LILVCGDCALDFARLAAVSESVALTVHFKDVDMMVQPVEKRACEALRPEGAGVHSSNGKLDVTMVDPRS